LLIFPILNIYKKYYGVRMMLVILGSLCAAMVAAGYLVEVVFGGLGLVPGHSSARVAATGVSWDYTTWLDIVFLLLAGTLIVRFAQTGGLGMLRMMGGPAEAGNDHSAHGHGASPPGSRRAARNE
jgi:uncharacterized protein